MLISKFSRINKELICDRIGKNPYSKELTNLILERIDRETTFMHHVLPYAIDFLRELFGDVDLGDSYSSALRVLKRYYKEGEKLYDEYVEYLGELGAINIARGLEDKFFEEKSKNDEDFDPVYGKNTMEVYYKYQYSLFNIIKLDEKISELKKCEEEYDNERQAELEMNVEEIPKRPTGVRKILDYFKKKGN